ncbi:Aste57867_11156 [Aphanomyces stellatus]|uniref:Aste57867_11156 protein n=1 Tax=Aphanomyces stellatus TaxID=120398 RepID=A0A485KS52_9STRA|nr:hypothetical protein As57867_011114 [Aphanomyces stellatus]VFT88023.1 Aste57867_11156 [Aphanomyces stellatus]
MALSLVSASVRCDAPQIYVYDPNTSGGVYGAIEINFLYDDNDKYQGAEIFADLDVSDANWTALALNDAKCNGPVTDFKWHIHTKWSNLDSSSGFVGDCSLANAGNHYDPDYACGPNSEHAAEDKCKLITPKYNCTPATYMTNPKACEKGDLSGKLGAVKNVDGAVQGYWVDPYFPDPSESTAKWNLMLHAVCGTNTPRFICATSL